MVLFSDKTLNSHFKKSQAVKIKLRIAEIVIAFVQLLKGKKRTYLS